ncbi:coiled-coil domain-containing protein 14 isoform X1 [Pantherophis guttatus]|uniref:Coiled-coil domain-containing protein 14 isoform X1 n=1 Tax=Pantherophis guttatus TaxID=94885 RepID=A0A6P9C3K7_PANGU|nr:coiled-coil domain-containing protein 14 isoform X1 [Pantherophis guttatus]
MARPGCLKHHKALTSGRLTGSTKLANRKKQIAPKKVAYTEPDGYSLYSTDSEDQVANIHHGLDRCASLLRDILQNESQGMVGSSQKAVKTTTFKAASIPLLNKMGGAKKRGVKKKTLSANVQKETASELKRKIVSGNETAAEKDVTPLSTKQAFVVKSIHGPCTQHSPVMHQKLCEHAQSQRPLLNSHTPVKSSDMPDVPLSIIPEEAAYQPFNGHLPTSTPALSPQQTVNPSVVYPGLPVDTCNQCVSRMGPVLVSGGLRTSASVAQTQPSALCSAPHHVAPSDPSNLPSSAILAPSPGREAMSQGIHEEQFNEAELIRCIQAQLALLQARERERELKEAGRNCPDVDPVQSKSPISKEPEISEEYNEGALSEEGTLDGIDMAPVRDTSCQTSFSTEILKPQNNSLQKRVQKVKTVKYLLAELKALLTDHDSETLGVLDEIDDTTSLLPAAVENTNVQAEIALALQPLRSENAQLRRRLRILNQQLKEQNRAEKEYSLDSNFEVVSLQSLNMTLQSQLNESMRSIELLQDKNEEFIKILESQKEENKRLTRQIHEKEQELLEKKQQCDIDSTKLKIEADEMLTSVKTYQYRLEAAEKENQILGITLRQRDAEVNRLRELTWALQGSMSKLLSDLTGDMVKPRQVSSLSKALLEIHEKQLQPDAYPLSDSIINYLKKLEMDPVLTSMEPLLSEGEIQEPKQVFDVRADEHPAQESQVVAEETVASRNLSVFQKLDAEAASCLSTLGGPELDETIYIPLSSSPSQKPVTTTERKTVIQQNPIPHKLECGSKQPSKVGMLSNTKIGDKFYGSFGRKMTVENKSETLGRIEKLESERLQMQPKERSNGSANVILNNPDRLQPDKHCYAQKGNGQKNPGISASDSSFSTLDWMSGKSEWTISSFSTFTSRDEEDFKNGLAALDANIARLQKTLQNSLKKQGDFESTSIVQNN